MPHDLFSYHLRLTCTVPLLRGADEPDVAAFDRFDVELLRVEDGEEVRVATALAFRVRSADEHLVFAADAEPDSPLLEDVCVHALEADGTLRPLITAAFGDDFAYATTLVLDRIEFLDRVDEVALVRGLLARGVLEHLGTPMSMLFLPPEHASLWAQAVGARRAGRFVVASADLVLPVFPVLPSAAEA